MSSWLGKLPAIMEVYNSKASDHRPNLLSHAVVPCRAPEDLECHVAMSLPCRKAAQSWGTVQVKTAACHEIKHNAAMSNVHVGTRQEVYLYQQHWEPSTWRCP